MASLFDTAHSLIVHPPSSPPRSSGHFYSNPSNWMWRILRDTGIAPAAATRGAEDDGRMPEVAGVVSRGQAGGQAQRAFEQARLPWPAVLCTQDASLVPKHNRPSCTRPALLSPATALGLH